MDDLSDYSPGFSMRECRRLRSSIRKRSYFRVLDVDVGSSNDESNSVRSGDNSPQLEPDNNTGLPPENLMESEYEAGDEGAGTETSVGEPIDEYEEEAAHEDEAASIGEPIDEYEEEELEPINDYKASGNKPNPNPWIAECDFGTAFLKYPVYTSNQRVVDPQPAQQAPDPGWLYRDQPAQPLIRASWAGDFAIHSSRAEAPVRCGGVKACVSAKACVQARVAVERLPAEVRWEKVPKYCAWPKSFERCGPNDNNIAVFFFPSLTRHEAAYDSLVMELVRDDMALKTKMGAQLLLFTSVELPPLFTRFQGKLYLWGVFRGNRPQL